MSLQIRLERLEHANANNALVIVWRGWDETADDAVARWRGEHPDVELHDRAVTVIGWRKPSELGQER
jgi:hypothetical protein